MWRGYEAAASGGQAPAHRGQPAAAPAPGHSWAVRTALGTALRLPTVIRQWWEYEGRPYFFRVRLDVSDTGLDETGVTDAMRLIFDYKNTRSWLDCLETVTTRPLPVSIAVAGIMRAMNRVRLWFPQAGAVRTRPCGGWAARATPGASSGPGRRPGLSLLCAAASLFAIISQSRSIVCPKP